MTFFLIRSLPITRATPDAPDLLKHTTVWSACRISTGSAMLIGIFAFEAFECQVHPAVTARLPELLCRAVTEPYDLFETVEQKESAYERER